MFIKGEEIMKNNNGKIEFNREFFVDLAKTVGLNVSHVRTLSDVQNHEIVVGGKLLDMLIDVQTQFERLEPMGGDEFRAFHIELPRPTLKRILMIGKHIIQWKLIGFM